MILAKTPFPNIVTFMGSRDEDMVIYFGGCHSTHDTIPRKEGRVEFQFPHHIEYSHLSKNVWPICEGKEDVLF